MTTNEGENPTTLLELVTFWWLVNYVWPVKWRLVAQKHWAEMGAGIFWEGGEEYPKHPDHPYRKNRDFGNWKWNLISHWLNQEDPLVYMKWVLGETSMRTPCGWGGEDIFACRVCGMTYSWAPTWGDLCDFCISAANHPEEMWTYHWGDKNYRVSGEFSEVENTYPDTPTDSVTSGEWENWWENDGDTPEEWSENPEASSSNQEGQESESPSPSAASSGNNPPDETEAE